MASSSAPGSITTPAYISWSLPDCCTYTSNGVVCRYRDPIRVSQGERVMNTEQDTAKTCKYDEAMETQGHFYSIFHPDSITVAGVYRDQASTSRVDDSKRIDALGRLLSSVLRHRAVDLGLKMRSDGYVLVKDLLNLRLRTQAGLALSSHTSDDIQEALNRDNKQRFRLIDENGQLLIRANQGHSIQTVKSEDLLHPILFPEQVPVCVHGTYLRFLDSIQKQGLKRMKRLHVHFAMSLFKEKGIISGNGSRYEVLIHLNVQKYLNDGMKLYCSENGVILAEGNNGVIPPDYFAKIERVKSYLDEFKMATAAGRKDETVKDSGLENVTNGEAMEMQGPFGLVQLFKPEGACKVPTESMVVGLQPSKLDAPQRHMVDDSNLIPIKGYNTQNLAQFQSDVHLDSIRVAGGYRHQATTSPVDVVKRIDSLGRQLSFILRHHAVNLGLKMRSDGYVLVNDLLNLRLRTQAGLALSSHTVDDIREVLKRDNKQRFGLREENGQLLIRANQGHSIQTVKSEDLLRPIIFPEEVPVCVHGTYLRFLDSIQKQGLKRMKRLHIHFATGLFKDKGVISGIGSSCEILIHLNVQKYLNDGMKLYYSENGVILAEGNNGVILPDYFARIELVKY